MGRLRQCLQRDESQESFSEISPPGAERGGHGKGIEGSRGAAHVRFAGGAIIGRCQTTRRRATSPNCYEHPEVHPLTGHGDSMPEDPADMTGADLDN